MSSLCPATFTFGDPNYINFAPNTIPFNNVFPGQHQQIAPIVCPKNVGSVYVSPAVGTNPFTIYTCAKSKQDAYNTFQQWDNSKVLKLDPLSDNSCNYVDSDRLYVATS